MNGKERVMAAMQHVPSKFPPFFVDFTDPLKATLSNSPIYRQDYIKYNPQICGYNYCGNPVAMSQDGLFRDDFGVIWDRGGVDKEIGIIHDPLIRNFDLSTYTFPELDTNLLVSRLRTVQENRGGRFFMAGIGFALFERAWSLCSMEDLLLGMVIDEKFIHELFSKICDFNLTVLDVILEFDIDAVYFGDDWGKADGLIMGKKKWTTFIKPYLSKMYKRAKKKNKLIIQHSCGNIVEIFPDLINMGMDCYQSFSPDVYNLRYMKEMYGDQVCFWGGLSSQALLTERDPVTIVDDIRRNVDYLNKNGGFILSPPNALTHAYPLENVGALLRYLSDK